MGQSVQKELRDTAKITVPLLAAVPAIALVAGILLRLTVLGSFWHKVAFAFEDAFLLAAIAAFLVIFVRMIARFYRHLPGQNAPVGIAGFVLPGMIVSFLWYVGAFLAGLIGCALIDRITGSNDYLYFLGSLADLFSDGSFLLCCLEALICAFLFHASVALHFCGAMALGHRSCRHPILMSVVFYILMSIAQSLVFALLLLLVNGKCSAAPFSAWLDAQLSAPYGPEIDLLPHKLFGLAALCLILRAGLFLGATIWGLRKGSTAGPR